MKIIVAIIRNCRNLVEQLSLITEQGTWSLRKAVIPSILTVAIGWIFFNYLSMLLQAHYDMTHKIARANELPFSLQFFGILALGLGSIGFEVVTRYLNKVSKEKNRRGIPTLIDRFVSLIPYFWLWMETTRSYQFHLIRHFKDSPQFLKVIVPLLHAYENLPGRSIGIAGSIIFFLLYFGIGRNRDQFRFVVRYHAVQAILTDAVFYFQYHIFSVWSERRVTDDFTVENLVIMFYSFIVVSIIIFAISAILGIPTRIPFLHEAIVYHTGEEKDDPFNKS